jgi:hypothetical protein
MTSEGLLAELLAIAQEQLRWQRATSIPAVKELIEDTLGTTQQRRAYEMCDGTNQMGDIADSVGVTPRSITNWTRRWRDLGIAYETEDRRTKHLASLDSLGLPIDIDQNGPD